MSTLMVKGRNRSSLRAEASWELARSTSSVVMGRSAATRAITSSQPFPQKYGVRVTS